MQLQFYHGATSPKREDLLIAGGEGPTSGSKIPEEELAEDSQVMMPRKLRTGGPVRRKDGVGMAAVSSESYNGPLQLSSAEEKKSQDQDKAPHQ